MTRAYNPTASPVIVDNKGHTLAGGEWGDVDETPQLRHAVDAGLILLAPAPVDEPKRRRDPKE